MFTDAPQMLQKWFRPPIFPEVSYFEVAPQWVPVEFLSWGTLGALTHSVGDQGCFLEWFLGTWGQDLRVRAMSKAPEKDLGALNMCRIHIFGRLWIIVASGVISESIATRYFLQLAFYAGTS